MQASQFTVPTGIRTIENGDTRSVFVFLTLHHANGTPPWDWYVVEQSQDQIGDWTRTDRPQTHTIYARPQDRFCFVLAEYHFLSVTGSSSQWTLLPKRTSAVYFETTKDVERSITLPLGGGESTEIRGEVRRIPLAELRELGIRSLFPDEDHSFES